MPYPYLGLLAKLAALKVTTWVGVRYLQNDRDTGKTAQAMANDVDTLQKKGGEYIKAGYDKVALGATLLLSLNTIKSTEDPETIADALATMKYAMHEVLGENVDSWATQEIELWAKEAAFRIATNCIHNTDTVTSSEEALSQVYTGLHLFGCMGTRLPVEDVAVIRGVLASLHSQINKKDPVIGVLQTYAPDKTPEKSLTLIGLLNENDVIKTLRKNMDDVMIPVYIVVSLGGMLENVVGPKSMADELIKRFATKNTAETATEAA